MFVHGARLGPLEAGRARNCRLPSCTTTQLPAKKILKVIAWLCFGCNRIWRRMSISTVLTW